MTRYNLSWSALAGHDLPKEIYVQLISGIRRFFFAMFVGGLVCCALAVWIAALQSSVLGMLAALGVVGSYLICCIIVWQIPKKATLGLADARKIDRYFSFWGSAWGLFLGLVAMEVLRLSGNDDHRLIATALVIGFAGSAAGHNISRPRVVIIQSALLLIPTIIGMLTRWDDYIYLGLSIAISFYLLTLCDISISRYKDLLRALLGKRDNAILAQQFDAALNNMTQGLAMFDPEGTMLVANARFRQLLEFKGNEGVVGSTIKQILSDARRIGHVLGDDKADVREAVNNSFVQAHMAGSTILHTVSGNKILVTYHPMEQGGWVTTYEDVSERLAAEAQLERLASYDSLTGLANRFRLCLLLDEHLKSGKPAALLLLDLDGFKAVNDSHGHVAGDELLCVIANRFRALLPDTVLLGRLGGDEFALLLPNVEAALVVADSLVQAARQPVIINGLRVNVGVSIGIALAPEHATDRTELLKFADVALYQSKADGRGRATIYDPKRGQALAARQTLESELRHALERGEISVHFQPQVDARTGRILGAEALARWHHPTLGPIPPATFIPLAEETGLIDQIGRFILREALREAAGWPQPLMVSVNVSASQLRAPAFVANIMRALADFGVPGARLELELTESQALDGQVDVVGLLRTLRAMDVRIALDDFGVGWSSLARLKDYDVDRVKIDRGFMERIDKDANAAALIKTIVELSSRYGFATIAEGIETEAQRVAIIEQGCFDAQGYLFSKPISAKAFRTLVYGQQESESDRLRQGGYTGTLFVDKVLKATA
jgi:diguanylate cyclase (GGDEF)-like protein